MFRELELEPAYDVQKSIWIIMISNNVETLQHQFQQEAEEKSALFSGFSSHVLDHRSCDWPFFFPCND